AQVADVDFLDTHGLGLGAGRLDLFALTEVGGEGHYFAVIGILQPLENHRGVQATGIRQDYLLYVGHCHPLPGLKERRQFYWSRRLFYRGASIAAAQDDGVACSAAAVVVTG